MLSALGGGAAASGQVPPFGGEFALNTYATEAPLRPRLAALPDGAFVAVWWDGNMAIDGSSSAVLAQRFDDLGIKREDQFVVNTTTSGAQYDAAVASDARGDFVVVWTGMDADKTGIFGQRFDAAGERVGPEFQVNTYATGYQNHAAVAMNAEGRFVVAWQSADQDASYGGVFGQRFDASGARLGAEFAIPVNTLQTQDYPAVGMDRAGDFVVCWQSLGYFSNDVRGQRFAADGTRTFREFAVNTSRTENQEFSSIAVRPEGDFVVTWTDEADGDLHAQHFDSATERVGAEFVVNETTGFHRRGSIATPSNRNGGFVVTWNETPEKGPAQRVEGRLFDRELRPITPQFEFTPSTSAHAVGVAATDAGPVAGWIDADAVGVRQNLTPFALRVDERAGAAGSSDRNGVLEPGEVAVVEPTWINHFADDHLTGTTPALAPCLPNHPCLTALDGNADYGMVPARAPSDCGAETPGPCFAFSASGPRPATHWDMSFTETLFTAALPPAGTWTWTIHVGGSFTDVPTSEPFYRKIETLLHRGITSGCTETTYCPGTPVRRDQMAIFVAKALAGAGDLVPTAGLAGGAAYDCETGGSSLFTDVAPADAACRHVHYLASQDVILGCTPTQYCPAAIVTRDAMASFIAKSLVAPAGGNAVPATYGPDPATGRSYSCAAGSPQLHFADVPLANPFCRHIHYVWAKGIVDGCSPTRYCPGDPVKRDAMAKFIANAFDLKLYEP